MRSIYLIAYDVTEDKRRTKIHHKLKGYGEALQYSLFRCALTPSERMRLRSEMWDLINHAADRMLLIDLGPDEGRSDRLLSLGGSRWRTRLLTTES